MWSMVDRWATCPPPTVRFHITVLGARPRTAQAQPFHRHPVQALCTHRYCDSQDAVISIRDGPSNLNSAPAEVPEGSQPLLLGRVDYTIRSIHQVSRKTTLLCTPCSDIIAGCFYFTTEFASPGKSLFGSYHNYTLLCGYIN